MSATKNFIEQNRGILDLNIESGDEDYLYEQYLLEQEYQAQLALEEEGLNARAEQEVLNAYQEAYNADVDAEMEAFCEMMLFIRETEQELQYQLNSQYDL